ncbi:unnamed protein product [Rotaria sordida]|uniref:ADP-ribosylglycohydrolase n=1 Tax=Rotaria sordida TaxID=392033 RepID=A0A814Z801_9BILA|nr:unnamed protein product [Rotaria sordida]
MQKHIPSILNPARRVGSHYDDRSEEMTAVRLYTLESGTQPLCELLHEAFKSDRRDEIESWFPYLQLFRSEVEHLPPYKGECWRGTNIAIGDKFKRGQIIIWQGISSCFRSINFILENCVGTNGTLIKIDAINGRDIFNITHDRMTQEIILMPGTTLFIKTIRSYEYNNHITVVELEEIVDKRQDENTSSRSKAYASSSNNDYGTSSLISHHDGSQKKVSSNSGTLIWSALKKLPSIKDNVYQGTIRRIKEKYLKKQVFTWWGITSCTQIQDNIVSAIRDKNSTLLKIKILNGKDISAYSCESNENEIVLLPGTRLRVNNVSYNANFCIDEISLEEINDETLESITTLNQTKKCTVKDGPLDKIWLDCRFKDQEGTTIIKPNEYEAYLTEPPETIDESILNRIKGSIFGLILGDALGAHVEFRPHSYLVANPVTDLQGGGTWGLKKGQFTDDGSMTLCLANSLVARHGFEPYDQLVRYKWWFRHGYMSSTGTCFDIGNSTKKALSEFENRQKLFAQKNGIPLGEIDFLSDKELLETFSVDCSAHGAAGNGVLMRLAPVPLFFYKNPEIAVKLSGISGQITHGDKKAVDACRYYGALIVAAMYGVDKNRLLNKIWLECRFKDPEGTIIPKPDECELNLTDPSGNIDRHILNRIMGSMFGLILGDALGAHVEFRPHSYLLANPVTDLRGGGTWGLRKGQFTDDGSMILCLANSLVARHGFEPYDQLVRYKCAHGAAGNGVLMRLAPVPLFFYKNPEIAVTLSGISGQITHGDKKAVDACRYYGALIVAAMYGVDKNRLLSEDFYLSKIKNWLKHDPLVPEIEKIVEGSFMKDKGRLKSLVKHIKRITK